MGLVPGAVADPSSRLFWHSQELGWKKSWSTGEGC